MSGATTAPSVGFVGAGRVARILLGGWARAGVLPTDVRVVDPDPAAVERLLAAEPTARAADLAEVAAADVVLVGVHPPAMSQAMADLAPVLGPDTVVVSLAPVARIATLAAALGDRQLARVIPNAPSIVGAGFNPVAFAPTATPGTRALVLGLLAPLGEAPEVADEDLEAYAVLTAMGPTYLWKQLYALLDVADGAGLAPDAAAHALAAMVTGALRTMADAGLAADAVQDLIPAKPLAEPVATMSAAYGEVLPALHARLSGRVAASA
ncbi:pyrroline-5-carboxylate reductase family protein [Actinotalea fermentans]|uniref:Pyrroline-5-carboxylate reductase n=1 Tax=Actinotalea fermentans TaxID=43671 RepID=A0A511Z1Q2_9CELL|nr:NAD(P)-binding domain-containing protein [Actinotalea fermentans]GEN81387.1 pyrroline-5-carboxylate reductase [Actinotalea fermentans]